MIANNPFGMACGTELITYGTIDSMILVLPSGTVVDTGGGDADFRLRMKDRALYEGLVRLRARVNGNATSVRIIKQQFRLKNTMGCALNGR